MGFSLFTPLSWNDTGFILTGILNTVYISVVAIFIGTILGAVVGFIRAESNKYVNMQLNSQILDLGFLSFDDDREHICNNELTKSAFNYAINFPFSLCTKCSRQGISPSSSVQKLCKNPPLKHLSGAGLKRPDVRTNDFYIKFARH